jgi:hypothetical protein
MGVLFTLPVTICKPEILVEQNTVKYEKLKFDPGDIKRHFIKVPSVSNFAGFIYN